MEPSPPTAGPPSLIDRLVPSVSIATKPLPAWWVAVLVLPPILLAVSCLPPIREWVVRHSFTDRTWGHYTANNAVIFAWSEPVRIICEVLIALAVGGQVFNEVVRQSTREFLDAVQAAINTGYENRSKEMKQQLRAVTTELKEHLFAKVTFGTLFRHVWKVAELSARLRSLLATDLQHLTIHFVMVRSYSLFPGGLYGFVAYLLFLVVLVTKCMKCYFDGPPIP